ncbi:hypothetical protein [Haloquadratum walsbyi]|uniref:hypothetical protein n=1 Tax=Haloquadratum walsbyi TaxID=293091 RepID=UPI000AFB0907|nr:hypothetical protein [Haloquadratum walsbyi]
MGFLATEELPNEVLAPVGDQEVYAAVVVLTERTPTSRMACKTRTPSERSR